MPSSLAARTGFGLDGPTVAANDVRLQVAGAFLTGASPSGSTGIASRPGVRPALGSPLLVSASSGMNVTVNAGVCFIQGTASTTAGVYTACLDTAGTITLATSDPTNPRIDNIIARVVDNGDNTSTTTIERQTGTPAPSPVAPTLLANSLLLAQIAVGASVSSIVSGNITDSRVSTVAPGGILPLASTSGTVNGPAGSYADDQGTGRLKRLDGSGNAKPPKVLPFSAVSSVVASNTSVPTTGTTTITSVSVTVDGSTEIRIEGISPSVFQATAHAGDYVALYFTDNGSTIADSGWTVAQPSSINGYGIPSAYVAYFTPTAGTHTIAWVATATTSTNAWSVQGAGGSQYGTTLRVSAVPG